jgi:ribA/ribD-fused uncharacterized protein
MKESVQTEKKPEPIKWFRDTYAFLSNFYESPFTIKGVEFKTVEHFFQAMKCTDKKEFMSIVNCETPGQARSLGRRVNLREDWQDIKVSVMYKGLKKKFEDPLLEKLLLNTFDRKLVEGNTWNDTYWGVCNGRGENVLGRLLMKVREELSNQ